MKVSVFICFLLISVSAFVTAQSELTEEASKEVVKKLGYDKGFCVVLGKGQSAVSMAKNSRFYIHALTKNGAAVEKESKIIAKEKLSLQASVVFREDNKLPYADNLINVLILPDVKNETASVEEILRVCVPLGLIAIQGPSEAMLKDFATKKIKVENSGDWAFVKKPLNPGFGTWSHIQAGPDLSYVCDDTEVAPWEEIRWIGDPRWGSLYSSYAGLVSAGGKIYYKESKKTALGNEWFLIAKDAYNGTELWRISAGPFAKYIRNPDQTVCCDDQYIYLRENEQMVARDGFTGDIAKTYDVGFAPTFATVIDSVLLISNGHNCVAVDKHTGEKKWERKVNTHPPADKSQAYVLSNNELEAIDFKTGSSKWKVPVNDLPKGMELSMSCKDGYAFVHFHKKWKAEKTIIAYAANSGSELWRRTGTFGYGELPDNDEMWLLDRDNSNKVDSVEATIVNTVSGDVKKSFRIPGGVMGKCWDARGTPNFLLYSNGWFFDKKKHTGHEDNSTRSPCRLGQHPANGLTYFMPHHCDCQVTLRGFLALSKAGQRNWMADVDQKKAFVKGSGKYTKQEDKKEDWPIYRNNGFRGNFSDQKVGGQIREHWSTNLGSSDLTQATAAYGLVFTAEKRSHTVYALDAKTGKVVWSFVAEGSIQASPSLHKGYCLFGTGSGQVYCLNAKDGALIWKRRVAPVQKFVGDRDKLDSPWPVQGSLYIHNDVAYLSAGHSSTQSIGFFIFGLKVDTGEVLWEKNLKGEQQAAGDMFLANDKTLFFMNYAYSFTTGDINKSIKIPTTMLRTTRYMTTVSIVDYTTCILPAETDKRHVSLADGRLQGDILSTSKSNSISAGRYATGFPGWKEKFGQYFLSSKGDHTWLLDDLPQQIHGLVSNKENIYTAGIPQDATPANKSELWVFSASDGKKLQTLVIDERPVYDGLSVAEGKLFLVTTSGKITCFGEE